MSRQDQRRIEELIRFENTAGEVFTARDLRANFYILNAAKIELILDPELHAKGFRQVSLHYEEHALAQRTLTPPASPVSPEKAPAVEPSGSEAPAAVSPPDDRVALQFMRGRNTLQLAREDGETLIIPVFYKTPLRDWIESILKALIILVTIQFFVVQTFYIPTGSMKETLKIGDYIMVEKLSYLFSKPARGDVVVFQYPNDPRKDFIKRMVAKEGDEVRLEDKQLIINDVSIQEYYTRYDDSQRHRYFQMLDSLRTAPRTVTTGTIFVMGDNRDHSHDSRGWGDLPLFRVKGRAWLVYWPFRDFHLIKHMKKAFAKLEP